MRDILPITAVDVSEMDLGNYGKSLVGAIPARLDTLLRSVEFGSGNIVSGKMVFLILF